MAKQIRSFWKNLCAVFASLFGLIVGGTVVKVGGAVAAPNVECEDTILNSSYTMSTTTTDDGVMLRSCTGGWFGACESVFDSAVGFKYLFDDTKDRSYYFFMGCAPGYYMTVSNSKIGTSLTMMTSLAVTKEYVSYRPVADGKYSCTNWEISVYDDVVSGINKTSGWCAKCPPYSDVDASTITTSAVITNCFMEAGVEYADPSGSGTHLWTDRCFYTE